MRPYMFRTVSLSIARSFSLYTVCTVKKHLVMDRGTVPKHLESHFRNKFEKLVHLFVLFLFPT